MNFRFLSILRRSVYYKRKVCLIKSSIKSTQNEEKKNEKHIFSEFLMRQNLGANGFRAEIFDRAPKVYKGTSSGSERK